MLQSHLYVSHSRAYVVGGWLAAIAANLVTKRSNYDVAVRDLVMGIGAVSLARMLKIRAKQPFAC